VIFLHLCCVLYIAGSLRLLLLYVHGAVMSDVYVLSVSGLFYLALYIFLVLYLSIA